MPTSEFKQCKDLTSIDACVSHLFLLKYIVCRDDKQKVKWKSQVQRLSF